MTFQPEAARKNLQSFDFKRLFIENLGWDKPNADLDITVDGSCFHLSAVAQKRGMAVFVVSSAGEGKIPLYAIRRRIETEARRAAHEHILIFVNAAGTEQKWQWVKRETGKPTACREFDFTKGQTGDVLIQRLASIQIRLDEEENLVITDVTGRVRSALDVERVTRSFYDRFNQEHEALVKFLKEIPDESLQRWYASVTLNRLMFVYFIQKSFYLNNDINYLQTHLSASPKGEDRFYREFLCPLFFDGFARPENERTSQINHLLGKVPYLNGGIFQKHQIELDHGNIIQIPDAAFERLFAFFEQYQWHLDDRHLQRGNEINPDVLGYIFEKYINQKEMGAYYTKEDITGYISKSTILPYLLEETRKKCAIAFEGSASVWRLLQNDPLRYIYPPVQKGCDLPLPREIAAGLTDVEKRGDWNKTAPADYALPTEIWREVVTRRTRFEELHARLVNGDVTEVNDLITYNLDIQQFTQDLVETADGSETLRAFWKALENIKVLDPTCGSGAFLFAALNILEPLYEACLLRMRVFVEELDKSEEKHRPEKFQNFRDILARVEQHPNQRYFIYKSIIIHNLFGVDIMEEAVEICKLRLFLKLVAQAEPGKKLEALPDIDFNIRAGNTLVGFTSIAEVRQAMMTQGSQMRMLWPEEESQIRRIEEEVDLTSLAYERFQFMQEQVQEKELNQVTKVKADLQYRLEKLNIELNRALAKTYGVDAATLDYKPWLKNHKPFHWYVEFFGILRNGGFDVIIGNPPYVEKSKIKNQYQIINYQTEECGNLYAFIMERSKLLLKTSCFYGFIVPTGSISSERMKTLHKDLYDNFQFLFLSHYSAHGCPSTLFEGAFLRLSILFCQKNSTSRKIQKIFSSKYMKWYGSERPFLFQQISFIQIPDTKAFDTIAKIENEYALNIWGKILKQSSLSKMSSPVSKSTFFYYYNAVLHWMKAFDFLPKSFNERDGLIHGSHYKEFYIQDKNNLYQLIGALNSNLFYLWFVIVSNCRDLTVRDLMRFPFQPIEDEDLRLELEGLAKELMKEYQNKSTLKTRIQKTTGRMELQEIDPRKSKQLINEIDRVLARHYGFTPEELDFIINYDIKYRMGADAGDNGLD